MTKAEALIIRSMLSYGTVMTLNQKQFDKADEVLMEVMPSNSYMVTDESENMGLSFCWAFRSTLKKAEVSQ
mgnify:CR=1 FL=1|jgi:hypothetical protein